MREICEKKLILTTLNSAGLESSLQKRQTLSRAHIEDHIELQALAAARILWIPHIQN